MSKPPFNYIESINQTKENLAKDNPLFEKEYNAFIVNRSFSFFADTVMIANKLNKFSDLPKKNQYIYYLFAIEKKKRFSKWHKKSGISEIIEMISDYYDCSFQKATEYSTILSEEQLNIIKSKMNKGGKS